MSRGLPQPSDNTTFTGMWYYLTICMLLFVLSCCTPLLLTITERKRWSVAVKPLGDEFPVPLGGVFISH